MNLTTIITHLIIITILLSICNILFVHQLPFTIRSPRSNLRRKAVLRATLSPYTIKQSIDIILLLTYYTILSRICEQHWSQWFATQRLVFVGVGVYF